MRVSVPNVGAVSVLLDRPERARGLYVLAHGAGAGMQHPFLQALTERLVARRVGCLRYQFPYMETGRSRPDPPHIAQATVRVAVEAARTAAPGLPLVAGGKSFGGRMTSQAQASQPLPEVIGLVFVGFPLHAPGRSGDQRAAHLAEVRIPMLCLQGTRDTLADLDRMTGVTDRLGPRATLHVVEGADHSFKVLKRSGRTNDQVLDELADTIAEWLERLTS